MSFWIGLVLGHLLIFHLAFALAVRRNDFSVIDQFWGPSLAWASVCALAAAGGFSTPSVLVLATILCIWAARLSAYVRRRSRLWGREDARYANWRSQWGEKANSIAYRRVFLLQALISIWIGAPILAAAGERKGMPGSSYFDDLAFALMVIGVLYESIADAQKSRFKAKPENSRRVMQTGLWKYSRHPNYFGEIVLWWGVSLWLSETLPFWWAIMPGLTMNVLLLKVSGVVMLELNYKDRPEFAVYRRRTNALLPWWPRADQDLVEKSE
jgi:steroid 5-alpha reductase family enzyme